MTAAMGQATLDATELSIMILDSLENSRRYASLHPGFARAFKFLQTGNRALLPGGRNTIDGDLLYASVSMGKGKGESGARLETHNKYIDIQFTVSGTDRIGWAPRSTCAPFSEGYDAARDLEFYSNQPESWSAVRKGYFAIFFPEDAHAPLATDDHVHKVVMKIATEWPRS